MSLSILIRWVARLPQLKYSLLSRLGRLIVCLGVCLYAFTLTHAQQATNDIRVAEGRSRLELRLEELVQAELIDTETYDRLLASYDTYRLAPLDLNTASLEELERLPLMSEYLAYQIIHYRLSRGGIISSVYDLKTIPGWSEDLALIYTPLLSCSSADSRAGIQSLARLLDDGRGQLIISARYRDLPADKRKRYLGSPWGYALLWQWKSGRQLSAMLGGELDSFEPWRYGSHRGLDSYVGNLVWQGSGLVRRAILGDYRVSWGEGLLVNQGMLMRHLGLGAQVGGRGVRPTKGLSESDYSRGVALVLGRGGWQVSLVGSLRYLDGRVDTTRSVLAGLSETGLHRTPQDWARRHSVPARHVGGELAYSGQRWRIALATLTYDWGGLTLRHATGASEVAELDDQRKYLGYSLAYQVRSRTGAAYVSGEVASSGPRAWAGIQRLGYQHSELGRWHIALRAVGAHYWSYYGQSYTHYRRPTGELGASVGWELPGLIRALTLMLEGDVYRSLIRRNHQQTTRGYLLRARAEYQRGEAVKLIGQSIYRWQEGLGSSLRLLLRLDHQLGARLSYSPQLSLIHTQRQRAGEATPWGYALGVRAAYQSSPALRLRGSATYYRTHDWQDRLYAYEPRLRLQYGSAFVYGRGYTLAIAMDVHPSNAIHMGASLSYLWRAPSYTDRHLGVYLRVGL